jgi:predicted enzyme related to lactoylglutathione lyase
MRGIARVQLPYTALPTLEVRGMAQPVVHFEVVGKDPARLREYFAQLFGWNFAVPSPVANEVSAPDDYGFLELLTTDDGTGIPGGVGGGPAYESHAVFYVGVPDVGAALQRAEDLGGTRVMGPVTSPNGLVVGHFKDPEGTLIGVAGPT